VGLRYGLGPEVLRDLTFRIEPHSFQFLTGPSGAGKTSLLRLLFLSLKPTRGLITQFSHDVATLSRDAVATLRRRIGVDDLALGFLTCFDDNDGDVLNIMCQLLSPSAGGIVLRWQKDHFEGHKCYPHYSIDFARRFFAGIIERVKRYP
jgi:ABC-type phosphonate transport system ATPase subunit